MKSMAKELGAIINAVKAGNNYAAGKGAERIYKLAGKTSNMLKKKMRAGKLDRPFEKI